MRSLSSRVFIYPMSYDLGFAPNPYNGFCTLACCKPRIRRVAKTGDWVIGMGGTKLRAAGRCVFAMRVTEAMTFDQYSTDPRFLTRRPVRNGTRKKLVGDNVYSRASIEDAWLQADCVHSLEDGTQCQANTDHDTQTNRVLISDHFIYFGSSAPSVPQWLLEDVGFIRIRDYCAPPLERCDDLMNWVAEQSPEGFGRVLGVPFDHDKSTRRYSHEKNRLV